MPQRKKIVLPAVNVYDDVDEIRDVMRRENKCRNEYAIKKYGRYCHRLHRNTEKIFVLMLANFVH